MTIIGLYAAKPALIGDQRASTGIFKTPLKQARVNNLGIMDDIQVDKRFHGGPEKALHQFSLGSYEKIIKAYPLLHKKAQPGSMGENMTVANMHELNVCIGDIYQVGQVQLQVSSPRIPCWKIDAKFKQPNLSDFINQHRLSGWYYRVVKQGTIHWGDQVTLQQRLTPEVSIDTMLKVINRAAQPSQVKLTIQAKGLDPQWQDRLKKLYAD